MIVPARKTIVIAFAALLSLASCAQPPSLAGDGTARARNTVASTASHDARVTRADIANVIAEIAFSPRQDAVFVAAPGSTPGDVDSPHAPRLLRLDPKTLAIQAEVTLPFRGFGIALDDQANRLYIGHGTEGAISVVDTTSNRVIKTIHLVERHKDEKGRLQATHQLRQLLIDPQRQRLYLPGLSGYDSALYVVDTRTLTLEKRIPGFGFQATGITLDEQAQRLFISNMQGQLMEVDLNELKLRRIREIDADQLINLAFDTRQRRVLGVDQGINRNSWRNQHLGANYVPRSEGHQLMALDADSGKILATAETDKYPLALLLDEQRHRLYVSNFNGIHVERGRGTLLVFDSRDYRLIESIPLPPHPASLAYDARNEVLYVTIKNDGARDEAGLPEGIARIAF